MRIIMAITGIIIGVIGTIWAFISSCEVHTTIFGSTSEFSRGEFTGKFILVMIIAIIVDKAVVEYLSQKDISIDGKI